MAACVVIFFKTSIGLQNKPYVPAFYRPCPVKIQVLLGCRMDWIEIECLVLVFQLHVFAAKKYFPVMFWYLCIVQLFRIANINCMQFICRTDKIFQSLWQRLRHTGDSYAYVALLQVKFSIMSC